MEGKLQKIFDSYEDKIRRYEEQANTLLAKMDFYNAHNLEEEYRISNTKYNAMCDVVYHWRQMHSELTDLLNTE